MQVAQRERTRRKKNAITNFVNQKRILPSKANKLAENKCTPLNIY